MGNEQKGRLKGMNVCPFITSSNSWILFQLLIKFCMGNLVTYNEFGYYQPVGTDISLKILSRVLSFLLSIC